MSQSNDEMNADENESQEDQEGERKDRTTPRQLWESRRQQDQADEAARRLNVQPVDSPEKEEPAMTNEQTESTTEDQSFHEDESAEEEIEPAEENAPTPSPGPSEFGAGISDVEEAEEEVGDQGSTPSENTETGDDNQAQSMEAEASDNPDPRMVEDEQQPGMMRYPYATHGPAPEGEEQSFSEKMIPSSFVLGILIIVGALLIGLALVAQHRRITTLENRVQDLETTLSNQYNISTTDEE